MQAYASWIGAVGGAALGCVVLVYGGAANTAAHAAALAPVDVGSVVQTDHGAVAGALDGSAYKFLGIPYAAPPVGDLRWRPPADAPAWSGTFDATVPALPCAQISGSTILSRNEDCLRLNIWAASDVHPRPVMVWLHGGGNFTGNALTYSPPYWGGVPTSGRTFVEQLGVVFVSVDSRQGALGFLAHPALDATSVTGTSGNYGVLDQIASLQWIQRNIASFGGDPRRVTVFGQSSGADDICALLASPLAARLFSNVIMESPYGRCETPSMSDYEASVGEPNVVQMGCATAADIAGCLRALPIDVVLKKQVPGNLDLRRRIYTPNTDGYLLDASPIDVVNAGGQNAVPFIIGSNASETSTRVGAIATEAAYQAAVESRYGTDLATQVLTLYPASDYLTPRDAFIAVTTDEIHTCPVRRMSMAAAKTGTFIDTIGNQPGGHSRAYRYFFRQVAQGDPTVAAFGAFHTLEVMYVFAGWNAYPPSTGEIALSNAMRAYWSGFAGNSNPSYGGGINWPLSDVQNLPYLDLIANGTMSRPDEGLGHCDFWDAANGYIVAHTQAHADDPQPFYTVDAPELVP